MNGFLPEDPNLVGTVWMSKQKGTFHIIQMCFVDDPHTFNDMGFRYVKWFKSCKKQTKYVFIRCLHHTGQCYSMQWEGCQRNYVRLQEGDKRLQLEKPRISANDYIRSLQS